MVNGLRAAFLDRHEVLSQVIAFGHLRDSARMLFVFALPTDEDLGVLKNLQLPGPALRRVIAEFAAVNIALRRSDAPNFLAGFRLPGRRRRRTMQQCALPLGALVLALVFAHSCASAAARFNGTSTMTSLYADTARAIGVVSDETYRLTC